jgi:hypothetical protein
MKILLAGHVSYNLIAPYCRKITNKLPGAKIGVLGLRRGKSEFTKNELNPFNEVIETPKWTKNELKSVLFQGSFLKKLYPLLFKPAIYLKLKSNIVNIASELLKDNFLNRKFSEYDIVNFQYISEVSYQYLPYIQTKQKVILTFWGSDLMQTAGVQLYSNQLRLIKRADVIVIQSIEMREIFLSKYGRNFKNKIRINYFGLDDDKFNLLHLIQNTPAKLADFSEKYKMPIDKKKVLIGYSGAKGQQHLAILAELEKQTTDFSEKLHLLIPMTYGNNDQEYYLKIEQKINSLTYSSTHFTSYMSDEEVACLYNIADVFINVRETDAFNGSMVECLYLDKIGIIGSWLPYKMLKKNKISYIEVDEINQINDVLSSILDGNINFDSNKEKIYEFASNNKTIGKWCEIYQELNEQ